MTIVDANADENSTATNAELNNTIGNDTIHSDQHQTDEQDRQKWKKEHHVFFGMIQQFKQYCGERLKRREVSGRSGTTVN